MEVKSLHTLEFNNWKSYGGHTLIGPFSNFNAIMGPNGSGKSNILDALSFVLGVDGKSLRADNLQRLVHETEHGAQPSLTYVQVTFKLDDNSEIVFRRTIKSDLATTGYLIDNVRASKNEYWEKLGEFNIFPKLKNFLVLQGTVDKLVDKSGMEITNIIEKISGSAKFKKEYDHLVKEEKAVQESIKFQYQKRRGITSEKKQYQMQKKEAEEYNQLVDSLQTETISYFMAKLWFIREKIKALEEDIDGYRVNPESGLLKLKEEVENLENAKKDQTRVQAKNKQTHQEYEKKIMEERSKIEKIRPQFIKTGEEIKHKITRISENEKLVTQKEDLKREHEKKIEVLRSQLAEAEIQESELTEELANIDVEEIQLTSSQRKQYQILVAEAGKNTVKERQLLEKNERQQQLDEETLESLKTEQVSFMQKIDELEKEISQTKERERKLNLQITHAEEQFNEHEEQHDKLVAEKEQARQEQAKKSDALRKIHQNLHNAQADYEQNSRREQFESMVERLKSIFPGVCGLVSDLSNPRKNYEIASAIAISKNMDSVIVEDDETAKDCINYLREQRSGIATFLPLSSIRASRVDDRLRGIPGSVPLIDVLDFNSKYQRAMEYVCGLTLVADNIDDARRIAFKTGSRKRVVTKDGMLLNKSGIMSGGTTKKTIEKSTKKWDATKVKEWKREKNEILTRLTELNQILNSQGRDQQLKYEMDQLKSMKHAFEFDLNLVVSKLEKLNKDYSQVEEKNRKLTKDIKTLTKAVETRKEAINHDKQEIFTIEDAIFKDFSDSLGVANFREYEEKRKNAESQRTKTLLQLANQKNRLLSLISYEETRDFDTPITDLRTLIADDRAEVESLEAQQEDLKLEIQSMKKKLDSKIEKWKLKGKELLDSESSMREMQRDIQKFNRKISALNKVITNAENKIEQLMSDRHNLYMTCSREDVEIPILAGQLPKDGIDVPSSQQLQEEEDIILDFTKLPKKIKKIKDDLRREEVLGNYLKKIDVINSTLDKLTPNLKAIDRLDEVNKQLNTTNTEFDQTRERTQQIQDRLKTIKGKRRRKFLETFEIVSTTIDQLYKDINNSQTAYAYLTQDNTEEPYLSGISYNAIPPGKTFGQLSNLSGGEKSLAALALLFSLQSIKPAPFFLLDEVDASLDRINVEKISAFLKKKSQEMQFIIISFKPINYSKADSLIGVYRRDNESTKVLTLDLSQYRD